MGCIADALEKVAREKAWLESPEVMNAATVAEEVAERFGGRVTLPGYFAVTIPVKSKDDVAEALRIMAVGGFHQKPSWEQYEVVGQWCITTFNQKLQMNVYCILAGAQCELVPVGVETRTKYALHCDGIPVPAEA